MCSTKSFSRLTSEGFEAMSFLFAGYLAVWTILFLYLVYLTKSQKQVSAKLEELSDKLSSSSDQ